MTSRQLILVILLWLGVGCRAEDPFDRYGVGPNKQVFVSRQLLDALALTPAQMVAIEGLRRGFDEERAAWLAIHGAEHTRIRLAINEARAGGRSKAEIKALHGEKRTQMAPLLRMRLAYYDRVRALLDPSQQARFDAAFAEERRVLKIKLRPINPDEPPQH